MPFIEEAINEAQESEAVPEGSYDLRVISADIEKPTKKGDPMTTVYVQIESPEYPNAAPIGLYFTRVKMDDEPNVKRMKLLNMKRFLVAFNIPHEDTGYDTDDFIGATANLPVKQEMVELDKNGNKMAEPYPRNVIVFPRLANEDKEEGAKPAAGASRRRR